MNQFQSQFTWLFMYQDFVAVHVMPYYVKTSYTTSLTTGYGSPKIIFITDFLTDIS